MSYSPTNWTDGTTPVDASNLNKIEDALVDQDSRIDANTDLIGNLLIETYNISGVNGATLGDLDDYLPGYYKIYILFVYTTTGHVPNTGNGVVLSYGSNYSFQIWMGSNGIMYFRRKTGASADWTDWTQIFAP